MTDRTGICAVCGESFPLTKSWRKYCSAKCGRKGAPSAAMVTVTCCICGEPMQQRERYAGKTIQPDGSSASSRARSGTTSAQTVGDRPATTLAIHRPEDASGAARIHTSTPGSSLASVHSVVSHSCVIACSAPTCRKVATPTARIAARRKLTRLDVRQGSGRGSSST